MKLPKWDTGARLTVGDHSPSADLAWDILRLERWYRELYKLNDLEQDWEPLPVLNKKGFPYDSLKNICPDCNGTGERPPDGKDSMGLPRWGHEMEDNRDRRCFTCRGRGTVPKE